MPNQTNEKKSEKKLRGFARLSKSRRQEIARSGGRKAHELGTAHQWSSEEAREAGRQGGLAKGNSTENK